jgi:hypothetical protein
MIMLKKLRCWAVLSTARNVESVKTHQELIAEKLVASGRNIRGVTAILVSFSRPAADLYVGEPSVYNGVLQYFLYGHNHLITFIPAINPDVSF